MNNYITLKRKDFKPHIWKKLLIKFQKITNKLNKIEQKIVNPKFIEKLDLDITEATPLEWNYKKLYKDGIPLNKIYLN